MLDLRPACGSLFVTIFIACTSVSAVRPARAQTQESPDAVASSAGGWAALSSHDYAEARRRFERALVLEPGNAVALVGLGDALFWLGDYQRALGSYERAIERAPLLAHAYNGVGHACLNLAGHSHAPRARAILLDRARGAFVRALALDPAHRGARDGLALLRQLDAGAASLLPLELVVGGLLLALSALCARALRSRHGELEWRAPLRIFVLSRAIVLLAFAAAPHWLPEAPRHPIAVLADPDSAVLDAVSGRWDANLYAKVARTGYAKEGSAAHWGSAGELPLLPIVFRWSSYVLDDERVAALLLPNAALLLATVLFFGYVRERHDARTAGAACWALLLAPGSLYGSVLYAESLALLFALLAVRAARGGFATIAAVSATLAGLARINTLAVVPLLGSEAFRAFGHLAPRRRRLAAVAIALSPCLGLLLFAVYSHLVLGDAFAYVHELRAHRFAHAGPLVALSELYGLLHFGRVAAAGAPSLVFVLALVAIVVYAAAAAGLFAAREIAAGSVVTLMLALALGSSLAAAPRYLWLAFPAAVWLGRSADRPGLRIVLGALAGLLLAAVASAFGRFYYVT
ncbi:MAG: tetratricopeptide repeat protein [Polyangiales bacterium]